LTNQGSSNLLTKAVTDMIVNRLLSREGTSWKDYEIQIGEAIIPMVTFAPLKLDKSPSHQLEDFCGEYFSKSYGLVQVFLEDKKLMIGFPAFTMYLEHVGYNTFVNKVVKVHHQNTPSFYIKFNPNNEGQISKMTIGFSEEPEKFEKVK